MAITRLSLDGYGARRAGSFAGRAAAWVPNLVRLTAVVLTPPALGTVALTRPTVAGVTLTAPTVDAAELVS